MKQFRKILSLLPALTLVLGTAYTVTVHDSEGNAVNTWTCSAMSYVYMALAQYEAGDPAVSDALANTVKALAVYYRAADAYFRLHND